MSEAFFAPVANKVLEGLISMAWIPQSESEGNELLLPCSNGIWSICVVFTSKTISFKVNWMSPFSRNANHDLYPPCYTWCQTSLVVVKAIWSKRPCSCWATWLDTPSTLCLTAGAASDTPWCLATKNKSISSSVASNAQAQLIYILKGIPLFMCGCVDGAISSCRHALANLRRTVKLVFSH